MPVIHGEMQSYALTLDKFLDHAAKWRPRAEVATACGNGVVQRVSYAELKRRSLKATAALQAEGVRSGEHVATLAWNTQAHVEVWYGIMGMGAVCHTLNPRLTDLQLADMTRQSEPRILIASADLAPLAKRVAARSEGIEQVLVIDAPADLTEERGETFRVRAFEPLLEAAPEDAVWGDFDETAPSGLCFTSGTTGAPKGVTYTHRGCFLHSLRQLQSDGMGLSATDSVLVAVPMFHANAWGLPFAVPGVGAKLVLPGRHLDGAGLADLINAEGVTVAVGVATVWLGLVEHLDATGGETPSLKRVVVGGAALPPALMERIEKRLGVTVQTSWGMTELSPAGTFAIPDDPDRAPHLSGRPALGVDLMLMGEDGEPLAEQRETEGRLHVRGAAVIQRYFGAAEPAVDAAGWFPTGDLARIDAEGNLIITGRSKDLIKSGGEWINPAEIEAVVSEHPDVSLAAVIGRPDAKWGERPVLIVQTREDGVSDEALLAPLRDRVAPWWIPDTVIRLDQMPLAPTGKIDKMRLRVDYGG